MHNMNKIVKLKPKISPFPKIATLIQARMTSTRFPGKSMAMLHGKPVIQWVLERARHIYGPEGKRVEPIIIVPDTPESEPILQLADKMLVDNFCGSEFNVLKRYYQAAMFFKLDYIIRITGDCPFIDPTVCTEIIQLLFWKKLDYASNVFPKRTYPAGLDCEVFTMDCLEAAFKLANTPYDLEHVTPWMQRTKEVKKYNVVQKDDKSALNWCVNYPEDIKRLEDEIKLHEVQIGANNNDNQTDGIVDGAIRGSVSGEKPNNN